MNSALVLFVFENGLEVLANFSGRVIGQRFPNFLVPGQAMASPSYFALTQLPLFRNTGSSSLYRELLGTSEFKEFPNRVISRQSLTPSNHEVSFSRPRSGQKAPLVLYHEIQSTSRFLTSPPLSKDSAAKKLHFLDNNRMFDLVSG